MTANTEQLFVPPHVPAHLVYDEEIGGGTGRDIDEFVRDPYKVWGRINDLPPLFWARSAGFIRPGTGCWVARGADVARDVVQRPDVFSNDRARDPLNAGGGYQAAANLVPVFMDPPEHGKYRALLGPVFSPKNIDAVEQSLEVLCKELIDTFADKGECDFMRAFARPFPVIVFMRMMGLPMDRKDEFIDLEHKIFQGSSPEERATASLTVVNTMRELIAERREKPQDDIVSMLTRAQIDGQPIAKDMLEGMCLLLFMAGLDTVAGGLGHAFRYLAEHPELQAKLRARPELIPDAVEELLRWHSWIPTGRFLTRDIDDFHGVSMKKGDWVQVIYYNASMDKNENDRPDEFIVPREANRHFAFGAGIHRCAGSHLARREMRIAVRMLLERLGEFRIKPGAELRYDGGLVCLGALPLEWR